VSTYRERREERVDRLREWADGREGKAARASEAANGALEGIEPGQKIMVGHHSERHHRRALDRHDRAMDAVREHTEMAEQMRSRADTIAAQNARSIYSDDPDAVDRLREKLDKLEGKREAMKAANAAFRKAHRTEWKVMSAYERDQAVPHPGYEISNIGGTITATRKRIAELSEPERGRVIVSKHGGTCRKCDGEIEPGETIVHYRRSHEIEHQACPDSAAGESAPVQDTGAQTVAGGELPHRGEEPM
jgi:Domain of unknown function (DUF3560)